MLVNDPVKLVIKNRETCIYIIAFNAELCVMIMMDCVDIVDDLTVYSPLLKMEETPFVTALW